MKRRDFFHSMTAAATASAVQGCSTPFFVKSDNVSMPSGTMPTRMLGDTGMEVSLLSFGSHMNGELRKKPRLRDRMIKLGYENGINLFDVYDHGGLEQFEPMGKSIKGFRHDVYVSLCAVNEDLQDEIDGALSKFKTDYIDLYRLYTVNDERVAIMEKNRKEGKIRAVGVVGHDVGQMEGYVDEYGASLDFVMFPYNFHHNIGRPGKKGHPPSDYTAFLPRCKESGLGVLGIKPMGSDDMVQLAREKNYFNDPRADLAKAMLRYNYETPEIDSTMPAMNSLDELAANLASVYEPSLSEEEMELLGDLSAEADKLRASYLRPYYKWLESFHVSENIIPQHA